MSPRRRGWLLFGAVAGLALSGRLVQVGLNANQQAHLAETDATYVVAHPSLIETAHGRAILNTRLSSALRHAANAHRVVSESWLLSTVAHVPYLGREVRGADRLAQEAGVLVTQGRKVLTSIESLQAVVSIHGNPASTLKNLSSQIKFAQQRLAHLEAPATGLFGPVGAADLAMHIKIEKLRKDLDLLTAGVTIFNSFFGVSKPTTTLFLGQNNAEMRDQGAVLTLAQVRGSAGRLHVVRSGPVNESVVNTPVSMPATSELFRDYAPTQVWSSVDVGADFSWTGQAASKMYAQSTGVSPTGVVAMDAVTMGQILKVTGPVEIMGLTTPLTYENFADVVLHQLYTMFPRGDQAGRRLLLGRISSAIFERASGSNNVVGLLRVIAAGVAGRHVILWSADAAVEAAVTRVGASGDLGFATQPLTFHVAVEAVGGAKLDPYIRTSLKYVITPDPSGTGAEIELDVTVTNTASRGLAPSYFAGPDGVNTHTPGEYAANVFVWQPNSDLENSSLPDSGGSLRRYSTDVLAQSSQSFSTSLHVTNAQVEGIITLHVVPQPNLVAQNVEVDLQSGSSRVVVARKLLSSSQTVAVTVTTPRS